MPDTPSSSQRDERLERILADYLHAVEAGTAPDRAELLKQHPDLAADLGSFFRNRDAMERMAKPIKEQLPALAETIGTSDTPNTGVGATVRYFGDYELLEEIARGGMGVVYRARQVSLNRIVAVKMILAGHLASEGDVGRFRAEAEAAGNVDHPNIVPIYEVGEHEGQHYFSMKLIEGGSLAKWIADRRLKTEAYSKNRARAIAWLLATVARAVHHAHQRGILHRDLKPGNILLDAQNEPHVTDFGLAKRVEGDSGMTQSGAIVGTPSYMAPEQARAEKQVTTAIDVYSLGAILYELLTGSPPFQAKTPLDTLLQVLEREPAPPRSLHPKIDRDLETISLKCLAKEPERRYESAAALADDLERWLNNEPIKARPSSPWERALKYVRRKPAAAALVVVSSLALMTLIGILTVSVVWVTRTLRAEQLTSYFQRIGLAQSEWQAGNLDHADRLLAECPADLRSWEWNYLNHVCHAEQRIYRGHAEQGGLINWPIVTMAFSADGRRIASLDRGGLVKTWDPDTGRDLASFKLDGDNIDVAAFSPDMRQLAWVCRFHKDPEATKTIKIWDLSTGKQSLLLTGHPSEFISAVAFSPDAKRLASACTKDKKTYVFDQVKIWDLSSGQELLTVGSGSSHAAVNCLAFSPDGRKLVTGGGPGRSSHSVRIWDTGTGKLLRELEYNREVLGVAYSPDGKRLAASGGNTLRVWDAPTGKEEHTLPGAGSRVVFSPDSKRIASNGPGPNVVIWELAGGGESVRLRGLCGFLAFSPDAKRLATDYALPNPYPPHWIKIWDTAVNPEARTLCHAPGGYFPNLKHAWSPDSRHIAVADLGCSIPEGAGNRWSFCAMIFESLTGKEACRLLDMPTPAPEAKAHRILDVAFSPDNRRLATLGLGGGEKGEYEIRVSDCQTARTQIAFERAPTRPGIFGSLAFCASGSRLALALNSKIGSPFSWLVEVCDADTGASAFVVDDVRAPPAVSRDGRLLATAHAKNGFEIHLWETATGKRSTVLKPTAGHGIGDIAFSPDGHLLGVISLEALEVWDIDARKQLVLLHTGIDWKAVAFSPDGKRLVTGSATGIITFWDAKSGQEVLTLRGHGGPILRLSFSPDGRFLASSGADQVTLWEAAPAP